MNDQLIADLHALADSWDNGEDVAYEHATLCRVYICPTCTAIACATDLRTVLEQRAARDA